MLGRSGPQLVVANLAAGTLVLGLYVVRFSPEEIAEASGDGWGSCPMCRASPDASLAE